MLLQTLILLAQTPANCAPRIPVVVCEKRKWIDPTYRVAPQYFIRQTNGSSEMQVNRCSYLAANLGKSFQYVRESKWCN